VSRSMGCASSWYRMPANSKNAGISAKTWRVIWRAGSNIAKSTWRRSR